MNEDNETFYIYFNVHHIKTKILDNLRKQKRFDRKLVCVGNFNNYTWECKIS